MGACGPYPQNRRSCGIHCGAGPVTSRASLQAFCEAFNLSLQPHGINSDLPRARCLQRFRLSTAPHLLQEGLCSCESMAVQHRTDFTIWQSLRRPAM